MYPIFICAYLYEQYTACPQEGGVFVLSGGVLNRIRVFAAGESAQVADVDAGTDDTVNSIGWQIAPVSAQYGVGANSSHTELVGIASGNKHRFISYNG